MKKPAKTALFAVLLIVLSCIGITIVMVIGNICPPRGPWPQPPWCADSDSTNTAAVELPPSQNLPKLEQSTDQFLYIKPGQTQEFLGKPVVFTHNWKLPSHDPKVDLGMDALNPGAVTWIQYHFDNNFIFESVAYYQDRNIPIIGAGLTPRHTNSDQPDPERDLLLAVKDIDGNPIMLIKPGQGVQEGRYWRNILDPEWQDELIETARKMVDAGIQGINFDEVFSNASVIYDAGGTFDDLSMAGFQEYLASKFTPALLSDKFDIDNIDTFNFKEHILEKRLQNSWNKDQNHPLPLTFEFSLFQLSESEKFLRRFEKELSDYSREKYDREFFFSYNASPLFFQHTGDMEYLDYLTGEQFYFMAAGTFQKGAGVIRLAEPQASKIALLIEISNDRGKIPTQTKNLYKYIFADIYSAGGEMITGAQSFITFSEGWNYFGDEDYIQFDPLEAGNYVGFLKGNPELFGLDRPVKVAVVNSYATRKLVNSPYTSGTGDWGYSEDLLGITEILLDLNVPFKVLTSGDTTQPLLKLTVEELKKYKIVILPSIAAISDQEVQALIEFAQAGGTIIQLNVFGLRGTDGQKITRPELSEFKSSGEHIVGDGMWRTENLDLRYYYLGRNQPFTYLPTEHTRDNVYYRSFSKILLQYYDPEVISDSPITVNIHRYQDLSRMVLHMVNYDYDQTTDEFTMPAAFNVSVDTGGKEVSTINLYDFEAQKTIPLVFEEGGGKVFFEVENLYAYSIVEVITK